MKNNPRAKEANTRVIQLDFNLPLYQPSLPSYFTQPPFFLEFVLYRSIKRSSGYFTFFFFFFFLPPSVASLATREGKKKKPRPSRGRSEGVARISVVYERAIKEKEREGKGYGCARNGQPGIYTNSTRGIRRRGEGGRDGNDSAELYRATDQRNYRKSMEILFSPAVSPLGFARLSLLSLFLSGSSSSFHVFRPFLRHARFPPSYVCVRVHTL